MKSSVAVLIVLVAAVCLIGCSDAWRWKRGGSRRGSGANWSRGNFSSRNRSRSNVTYVLVRKVDEPHPYFRILQVSTINGSLSSLNSSLAAFFNKSAANITMIVRNDKQLITNDMEASRLKYKDQLEVTFKECGAPTRSKTLYAYTKDARRQRWSMRKQKVQRKDLKRRRNRPAEDNRRRRPASSEADEVDEAMEEFKFF